MSDPRCPYKTFPERNWWRQSVAEVPRTELDPHAGEPAPFTITPETRIVTAGSCFAQHIARVLRERGFSYLVGEPGPPTLTPEQRAHHGYGAFSARYGNVYTPRQLVQLVERAEGRFVPEEPFWPPGRHKGWRDPFRPQIQPNGFASAEEAAADRAVHVRAVGQVLRDCDVFVFTLGLTETWISQVDGAVFPVCPGCPHGSFDPARYAFKNFTVGELIADLHRFLELLGGLNPRCRVIFTVSPVPLVATAEPRHALTSTVYSKSALRAAADEVARAHAHVTYFGSYEVICHSGNDYFAPDRRGVVPAGVAHVMRTFFARFCPDAPAPQAQP
ncbi:MAG: GSCFA domain-containing protein [Planctomycetes bacterium]|nr:GSCFA domain-containing protein [Planctomycetota bacterium]